MTNHIAHSLTQTTIARHGLRAAVDIIAAMQVCIADVVRDQQRRHPDEYRDMKPPPPLQPSQTEPKAAKKSPKVPPVPRIGAE
jgi:hypothetical protein